MYTTSYKNHTSKSIRVEDDTHAVLASLKGEDETFDELLSRLVRERRETVREGAGLWEGTDAAEKARDARREMKRDLGSRCTLYDSSVLIDYLDGGDVAVDYADDHLDERAIAPPLVMFEVYQGEVFKSGSADFESVNAALGWLTVVDETTDLARAAGELQDEPHRQGEPLAARDAFVAGAAKGLGERLVVADSD